MDEAVPQPQRT